MSIEGAPKFSKSKIETVSKPESPRQIIERQAGEIERLKDIIARLGIDETTGILKRDVFLESVQARIASEGEKRKGAPTTLSIVYSDIDLFKKANDTYGHNFGDIVLNNVAQTMKEGIRGGDIIGRMGGEEICIAAFDMDEEEAKETAEKLRQRVKILPFLEHREYHVTASFGVATADTTKPLDLSELIMRADFATYESKKDGRDRVTSWNDVEKKKENEPELQF